MVENFGADWSAPLAARLEDRREWIAKAKAAATAGGLRTEEGKAAGTTAVVASREARERSLRVLDRQTWIGKYKASLTNGGLRAAEA